MDLGNPPQRQCWDVSRNLKNGLVILEMSNSKIQNICIQIAQICNKCNYEELASSFLLFANDLKLEKGHEVRRTIIDLYRGSGSFNDIVLQHDNKVHIEQKEFDQLRTALYKEITSTW
jgi:DNA-directed RNA polymerase subunit E'/Rpb7